MSVYDYTVKTIDGKERSMAEFKGRVLLIVNVASKCGFTPQYKGLEALYRRYKGQHFSVLGFPSDQFANQEPGTEAEIMQFCGTKYDVTFPMFAKVDVNGDNAAPLFAYLTSDKPAVSDKGPVKWNFEKFLIDRQGNAIARYRSKAVPTGEEMTAAIEKALAAPAPKESVFAGGCFWCTELVFEQLEGVLSVESGYAGGKAGDADYDRVSSGSTDHAEAIRVRFDPSKITYEKLLEVFFTVAHDPTQLNRQGNDVGRQYRSAIFYATPEEKQAAEAMINGLTEHKKYDKPIVTTLEPLETFYPAEAYHQDYARLHPNHPYIASQALPKVRKLQDRFPETIVRPAAE